MQALNEQREQIEVKILSALTADKREIHIEQLATELGIARHTAAKYLEILLAKGKVRFRKVGNAKLWRAYSDISIRQLTSQDITAVLNVERLIEEDLGAINPKKRELLEERIRHWIARSEFSLGGFLEGRLLGFAFGELRSWQFGCASKTGWIEVIGVEPEFRRLGVGRALAKALISQFRQSGAERVRTLVDLYAGGLLSYFRTLGFQHLNMLPLELQLMESAPVFEEKSGDQIEAMGGGEKNHDTGD